MAKTRDTKRYDKLVDRNEIAHIVGVGPTAVSNYVAHLNPKYPEFPEPLVVRAYGRFKLWHIDDVKAWWKETFPYRHDVWQDYAERLESFRQSWAGIEVDDD